MRTLPDRAAQQLCIDEICAQVALSTKKDAENGRSAKHNTEDAARGARQEASASAAASGEVRLHQKKFLGCEGTTTRRSASGRGTGVHSREGKGAGGWWRRLASEARTGSGGLRHLSTAPSLYVSLFLSLSLSLYLSLPTHTCTAHRQTVRHKYMYT